MIVTCNDDTYPNAVTTCGMTFNDTQRSTVCPHEPLPPAVPIDPPRPRSEAATCRSCGEWLAEGNDGKPKCPNPACFTNYQVGGRPALTEPLEATNAPGLFALADTAWCPVGGSELCGQRAFDREGMARHLALVHDTTIAQVEAEELAKAKPPAEPEEAIPTPPSTDDPRAVAAYLLDFTRWASDRGLDVDHGVVVARANAYATLALVDAASRPSSGGDDRPEPCGAYAIAEWYEGTPRQLFWCDRRSGPCPFAGAVTYHSFKEQTGQEMPPHERPCAVRSSEEVAANAGTE